MRRRAYRKEERQEQIATILMWDIQRGNTDGMTMYKIAKELGMRPATTLLKIINDMVLQGLLVKKEVRKVAHVPRYVYTLKPGTYELPKQTSRIIRLNKGKKSEVVELP